MAVDARDQMSETVLLAKDKLNPRQDRGSRHNSGNSGSGDQPTDQQPNQREHAEQASPKAGPETSSAKQQHPAGDPTEEEEEDSMFEIGESSDEEPAAPTRWV